MPYRAILEVHEGRWRQIRPQAISALKLRVRMIAFSSMGVVCFGTGFSPISPTLMIG
jgi:hypothetical protein